VFDTYGSVVKFEKISLTSEGRTSSISNMGNKLRDEALRDAWHEHNRRLTFGNKVLPSKGRCQCGSPLMTDAEAINEQCVDCEVFRRRMDGAL
jgi:hypothetical protein